MRIIIEKYNPIWPQQFLEIKAKLEEALSEVTYRSIEHVGSTSVVGLAAKPIIDVDVVVRRDELYPVINALQASGLEYLGERGVPDRHAFRRGLTKPAKNLYVCVEDSQALRNHLLVRDVCRGSDEMRDMYGQAKLDLSTREWKNVDEYTEAKNDVLALVLGHGMMTSAEIDEIRSLNKI